MGKFIFKPKGVCARQITFDIEDGVVKNIEFMNGCNGNAQGISKLGEGMKPEELIKKLSGIKCDYRQTSCPDQFAIALREAINEK